MDPSIDISLGNLPPIIDLILIVFQFKSCMQTRFGIENDDPRSTLLYLGKAW